jgi:hypothetical protein
MHVMQEMSIAANLTPPIASPASAPPLGSAAGSPAFAHVLFAQLQANSPKPAAISANAQSTAPVPIASSSSTLRASMARSNSTPARTDAATQKVTALPSTTQTDTTNLSTVVLNLNANASLAPSLSLNLAAPSLSTASVSSSSNSTLASPNLPTVSPSTAVAALALVAPTLVSPAISDLVAPISDSSIVASALIANLPNAMQDQAPIGATIPGTQRPTGPVTQQQSSAPPLNGNTSSSTNAPQLLATMNNAANALVPQIPIPIVSLPPALGDPAPINQTDQKPNAFVAPNTLTSPGAHGSASEALGSSFAMSATQLVASDSGGLQNDVAEAKNDETSSTLTDPKSSKRTPAQAVSEVQILATSLASAIPPAAQTKNSHPVDSSLSSLLHAFDSQKPNQAAPPSASTSTAASDLNANSSSASTASGPGAGVTTASKTLNSFAAPAATPATHPDAVAVPPNSGDSTPLVQNSAAPEIPNHAQNSSSDPAKSDVTHQAPAPAEMSETRVINHAQLTGDNARSEIHISFQGDRLGPVEFHARVTGEQVGAAITVDKKEAHAALAVELPSLQQALAEKQLRVEQVVLTQGMTHTSSGSPEHSFPQQQRSQANNATPSTQANTEAQLQSNWSGVAESASIFDERGRLSVLA